MREIKMGKVIDFPGKKAMEDDESATVYVPEERKEMLYKVIIGENEFYVDTVSLPELKFVEWVVHTLEGPTRTNGPQYWSPLGVTGPEQLGDLIQGGFPLKKLILEIIDPETEIVEDWWEFYEVFLSTESENHMYVILFRNASKRKR